jgi:hypothetical protein
MVDVGLGAGRIPVQEDSNARLEGPGHFDFISAKQWNIQPAHLAGSQGGKLGIEIPGNGKDRTGDIFGFNSISADDKGQQLAG